MPMIDDVSLAARALDIAPAAVALTRRNAERLGVFVTAFESAVFAALPSDLRGRVDAIVAIAPYISTSTLEGERAGLLANEPREAFDAGPYGLALHPRIVADARTFSRPDGLSACEFGRGQERQLRIVLERARVHSRHLSSRRSRRATSAHRASPLRGEPMSAVRDTIRTFISKNFYVSAEGLTDVESLLDRGVVDSTAILEVISFLEETFAIRVDDAEILPENLDSIAAIARFVEGKQRA